MTIFYTSANKFFCQIRLAAETTLGLAAWMSTLLGVLLTWAVLSVLLLILLVALLHRPLPPYIADRKKIKMVEFMMRISNEYLVGKQLLIQPSLLFSCRAILLNGWLGLWHATN